MVLSWLTACCCTSEPNSRESGSGSYRLEGDCRVLTMYNEDGTLPDIPTAPQLNTSIPVGPALDALCQTGRPTALCNRAPACGDGACTGDETDASCAADCPAAQCGDQVCDLGEELSCADDCAHLLACDQQPGPVDAGPDAGPAGVDAGREPDAGTVEPTEPGCDCRAGPAGGGSGLVLVLLGVVMLLGWRRRGTLAR